MATVLPLNAIDLEVEYLEGFLEYREGRNTWIPVDIGESVPGNASIRLSDHGFAELNAGGRTVTLTKDGLYEAENLIGSEVTESNLRNVIGSKFSALLNRKPGSEGMTVAAVRGAEAEGDDFISWEDETTDYLSDGMALFDDGDIMGAKDLFDEGTIWETGAIQRECTFRMAVCQQILGDPRGARNTLSSVRPEPDDAFYGEFAVMSATLYLESMDYAQADKVLTGYLETNPRGEDAQAAWFLSAFSKDGQGHSAASRQSLQKAVDLGPNTEIGRAAAEML